MMQAKAKCRNPAIECYRVLLMFLIVLHHAAYNGQWNHALGLGSSCPVIYWLFTMLIIWHVDGFIAITGWFGTRFTLTRFAKLWGIMAFYSLFSIGYSLITTGHFHKTDLAGGWFGMTYLYFLFLSPLINAAIDRLILGPRKLLYTTWLIYDAAILFTWAQWYGFSFVAGAGAGPFSIMTFITIYVNVRLIKLSGIYEKFNLRSFCAAVILFSVGLTSYRVFRSEYNAPHVILMAVVLLLLFAKYVRIPAILTKVVTSIAPLTFGIYVLHETTSFGRLLYRIPQEWIVAHGGGASYRGYSNFRRFLFPTLCWVRTFAPIVLHTHHSSCNTAIRFIGSTVGAKLI